MNILITICARGGSKGIPGKNIKSIAGQPLIAYSIATAIEYLKLNQGQLVLSTDSEQIREVAKGFGLVSDYERPDSLATDGAGKLGAIKDILRYTENKEGTRFDYVLDLDVTSPLRTVEDLGNAFQLIEADKKANNLFSVSDANRNPYFNMVEKRGDYYFKVKDLGTVLSRQKAPVVYDVNASFYFYRRAFFDLDFDSVFTDKTLIYNVPHLCFDLDEPVDFEFMSFLLENNKLDFKL
jgi:CMP-N,N'-diacetyllegionaminic acid synthase